MRIERNGLAAEWAAYRKAIADRIPGTPPQAFESMEAAFYAGAMALIGDFGAARSAADLDDLLRARLAEIAAYTRTKR